MNQQNYENYETPDMEVVMFGRGDVVTFSNGTSDDKGDTPLDEVENDGSW